MKKNEDDFVCWMKKKVKYSELVEIPIGDDASVVSTTGKQLILKVDTVVEGVHFEKNLNPAWIGHKALARPLSDVAAMGGKPLFALCAMVLRKNEKYSFVQSIFSGLYKLAGKFSVSVVGGDITQNSKLLMISITVVGECAGLLPIRRKGAKVGDAIFVTGKLGGSILNKNYKFIPRIKEGVWLNKNCSIHSMIDISDGLALDLARMCELSGVGAEIYQNSIPHSKDTFVMSKSDKKDPLDHALYDGEDYELLFTAPSHECDKIIEGTGSTMIGKICKMHGIYLKTINNETIRIKTSGWRYEFK